MTNYTEADILSQARAVQVAREKATIAAVHLSTWKAQWEEDHREVIDHVRDMKDACDAAEAALREMAVTVHKATGVTRWPGVEVRQFDVVTYDERSALDWALTRAFAEILELDKTLFERVAKLLHMDFVTITKEPRAEIATDLKAALGNK